MIKILNIKYFRFLKVNLFNLIYIGAAIALVLLFFILPDNLNSSLKGIAGNLGTKLWGGTLIFICSSLVFITFRKRERIILEKSILSSIFLIILSIISFSFFRAPFYKSLYDSSNRLFVMLIPIAIFYLTLKFHSQRLSQLSGLFMKN